MKVLLVALNAHYMHTNLALRQMKAALPDGRFDVELVEGHINLPFWDMLMRVARAKPRVVGLSTYIWNVEYVLKLCRALKRALPGAVIFLGGPEAAYNAQAVLEQNPSVDLVLSGEGERSLEGLLRALEAGADLQEVPGAWYREGGRVRHVPDPPPLPPEDWPDPYPEGICGLERRILYLETSRGCPYRCAYCLSSAQPGVRALPAEEAVRRLTRLAGQGARLIKLVDRTFNFDPQRARAIWSGLMDHAARSGCAPTYHFEIGAHLLDEPSLELLAGAPKGLFQFEVGVQSASARVLDAVSRAPRFEAVRAASVRVSRMGNIPLHIDLIAGLPGEGLDSVAHSLDEVVSMGPTRVQLGFLKLLHGSALRAQAGRQAIVFQEDPPYEVIATGALSFDELCHLKDVEQALEWYYNQGRYPSALRLLLEEHTPYQLFSALARGLRALGMMEAGQRERARAEALYRLGSHLADPVWLAALMRHDLLLGGLRAELPEALAFEEDSALRAELRRRFHPVRGQSGCLHPVDVLGYLATGRRKARASALIYDPATRSVSSL